MSYSFDNSYNVPNAFDTAFNTEYNIHNNDLFDNGHLFNAIPPESEEMEERIAIAKYWQDIHDMMRNLPHKIGKRIDVCPTDDHLLEKYRVKGLNNNNVLYRVWDKITLKPIVVLHSKEELIQWLEDYQNSKPIVWNAPVGK